MSEEFRKKVKKNKIKLYLQLVPTRMVLRFKPTMTYINEFLDGELDVIIADYAKMAARKTHNIAGHDIPFIFDNDIPVYEFEDKKWLQIMRETKIGTQRIRICVGGTNTPLVILKPKAPIKV